MTSPPPALSDRQRFLDGLAASGLLSVPDQARAGRAVPPHATAADAARTLVAAGLLTSFQADRILAGRTDGFVLGQYVVRDAIGQGTVGRVYRARHRAMNRPVALKVISPDRTRTAAARAAADRGVRAAAGLAHPHVVATYDANAVGDRFYVVLEHVDGPSLQALVADRGPLPVDEACELARQAALGLAHAHARGLVHRNVKPANLLLARPSPGAGWTVKVADFGLADVASPAGPLPVDVTPGPPAVRPADAAWLATLDFAAPDRADGSPAADVYSLGAVLFFLLTGRPPFPGGTARDRTRRHRGDDPPALVDLRPDAPPGVVHLVHLLLAKDPLARPTAADVADRLGAFACGAGRAVGAVNFDLPPAAGPTHTMGSGYLTGIVEENPSPWSELTDPGPDAAAETLGPDEWLPPVSATVTAKGAVSPWAVFALGGGVLGAVLLVIAALVKAVK